jgi:hypothetical protein
MDAFAQLPESERRIYFEQTAARLGVSPQIVEKDFWVCWTLKQLFSLPDIGPNLIFKGGTSLSKVFKIIERFSEDIDVSIERGYLGFGGDNEPESGSSNKERRRRIEALKAACQRKIEGDLLPNLTEVIHAKVPRIEKWLLRPDDSDPDRQTLIFEYPQTSRHETAGFVRRVVKIEMGARADHWPCEAKPVAPYVAEEFPQAFRELSCVVKVLSVKRTFWEKATILHAEYFRPPEKAMPERFSRHYCDFYELIQKGVGKNAGVQLELLKRVAQHKSLFFKSAWARYGEAARGTLKIAPPEQRLTALREDYRKMQEMFFGTPPEFSAMINALQRWEFDFNGK